MKKNWKVAAVAGAMAITMMISTACQKGEKKAEPKDTGSVPAQTATVDGNMMQKESIKDYFDQLTFLTEEEKAQLVKDEEESKPLWEKLNGIYAEMQKAEEKIQKDHAPLFEKQSALMMRNEKIWQKLSPYGLTNYSPVDQEESIKNSKDLTEEERTLLLKDVEELKALQPEFEKVLDEIADATASLRVQAVEYEKQLMDISEKSRAIWDKIHQNDINMEGYQNDVMPF